jgi:hypothetical protein
MGHFGEVARWRTPALSMTFAANASRAWVWGDSLRCTAFFRNFLSACRECLMTPGDSYMKKFFQIAVQSDPLPETLASIGKPAIGDPFGGE